MQWSAPCVAAEHRTSRDPGRCTCRRVWVDVPQDMAGVGMHTWPPVEPPSSDFDLADGYMRLTALRQVRRGGCAMVPRVCPPGVVAHAWCGAVAVRWRHIAESGSQQVQRLPTPWRHAQAGPASPSTAPPDQAATPTAVQREPEPLPRLPTGTSLLLTPVCYDHCTDACACVTTAW